jgi:pimeloyl-ACP methyl ester carboxylesterase
MPRGYVTTRLGQVHYTREGQGPALLLLGASGRSSRMFAPLIPRLAPHCDVVALDTPGFGQSDPLPPGTSIPDLAACCVAVLDALGIARAHLYGLHSGNKIGAALAVGWPERLGRLILAGQSHSLIPDQVLRNGTILGIVRETVEPRSGETAALADWAAAWQRLTAIWWTRDLVAGGAAAEAREAARLLALDELQCPGAAGLYAENFRYDLGADYPRIQAPTLVLEVATPEEDRTIGRQGPAVQALIPGAALATLHEPEGHTLTLENRAADLAAIILDFLAREG